MTYDRGTLTILNGYMTEFSPYTISFRITLMAPLGVILRGLNIDNEGWNS